MFVSRFFNYPLQVFRPIVKRLGVEFDCDIVRRLVNLTHSDKKKWVYNLTTINQNNFIFTFIGLLLYKGVMNTS